MLKSERLSDKLFNEKQPSGETKKPSLGRKSIKKILEHLTGVPFKEILPDLKNQLIGVYEKSPCPDGGAFLTRALKYKKGAWQEFVKEERPAFCTENGGWGC